MVAYRLSGSIAGHPAGYYRKQFKQDTSMNPTPFNLSVLKTGSFLQLDDSGKFLVSKAGSVHTEWKLPASIPGKVYKPSLIQTLAFGEVSLSWTSGWFTVKAKSKAQWGINVARFSGKPTLKVAVGRDGKRVTITLKGARFPGFDLSADLVATLSLHGQTTTLAIDFPFCGFSAKDVPLVKWLEGSAPASALVFFDDFICRVTTGVHLRLAGVTWATFNPSWLFVFGGGQPFVDLTTEGDTISSTALALALLAPGMPSVLPLPANRRAALFIPEKTPFDMPLWPERASGWRFMHPAPAFSQLFIEADEQLDGSVRRAMTAVGAVGSTIFFEPGADLLNDFMTPFAIPLLKPLYVAVYSGDGVRLGATLLASRASIPLTAHTAGCSLYLGAVPRRPGFMLTDIPPGDSAPGLLFLGSPGEPLQQGLPFSLIATAPRMGDFVVDPMPPLAPSTMLLAISPIGRELTPAEGVIALSDTKPEAHILLPDWIVTQIVRPRDLMVIGLQFLGLRPAFSGAKPGRLLRSSADVSRILVYFPPQSMGELASFEDEKLHAGDDSVDPIPINYRSSGLSRLAFDLPDDTARIDYTPGELLNWKDGVLIPRLDARAVSSEDTVPDGKKFVQAKPGIFRIALSDGWFTPVADSGRSIVLQKQKAPALDTTVIEAPYRLLLSPDQHGCWDSDISTAMKSGSRAVLWHTRLGAKARGQASPLVRAIWSVDNTPGISKDPFGEKASLLPEDRNFLVTNSAKIGVDAKLMMLTSLGAWLNLDGDWSSLPDDEVTLEKWLHRSTLGRDQFVQVVKRGYLYPFGHKAVLVEITERKFGQKPAGYVGAWLRKRNFIVVKEFERNYAEDQEKHGVFVHQGREIPFRSVRVLTKVTRLLDLPRQLISPDIEVPDSSDGVPVSDTAFWPRAGDSDFMFHLNATDWSGNIVEFSAPLAFVRNDVCRDTVKGKKNVDLVVANQQNGSDANRKMYAFGGQKLFFAQPKGGQDEALEATLIGFKGVVSTVKSTEAWHRPFYPKMTTAKVVVPAMRQFAGITSANVISYYQRYLDEGFGGSNSNGEIYVKFDSGVAVAYGSDNKTDKAGGIISPGMLAGGLSRAHGPVGVASAGDNSLNNYASGIFNPAEFFSGMSAKILGGLDLFSILETVSGFDTSDLVSIPRWVNNVLADGSIRRTFTWKTDQLKGDAGSFTSSTGRSLEVDCQVIVKPASADIKTRVNAVMKKFDITLAEVIKISFNEFSMLVESGSKPKVNVDITNVSFEGGLSFVSAIAEALHLDSFKDASGIDVSPEGISLSYGIQLPSIQLGVLALRNLALNASATLPFIGDPFRARFALSERQDPFSISVSFFTGGGFFAIGVGLDGVEMVEVSLEFGGNFSLDIGVASGGVHAMAGIYIKYLSTATESYTELTGYVRLGGSLSVLGLIGISVEFYLSLSYVNQNGHKKAWGEARMTVEISILFFSIDVELKVRREFAGDSADPVFGDTFAEEDWNSYLEAFAA
jgi:hypothetical protein